MDRRDARATKEFMAGHCGRARACAIAIAIACAITTDAIDASADGSGAYAVELGGLVNEYRKLRGLAPLVMEPRIELLAKAHSADMARAHRMSHDGFQARMQKTGYKLCVENVGWNYPGAQQQLEGWKNSPGHDHNLRDARVTQMGIGISTNYVTFIACG